MLLPVKDTLQIGRRMLSSHEFEAWFSVLPFVTLPLHDLHTTVAYSRTRVDWNHNVFCPLTEKVLVSCGHREIRHVDGGAIVLTFESDELSERWQELVLSGAFWDFADYVPHVTLGYGSLPKDGHLTAYEGTLVFDCEYRKTTRL